MWNSKVAGGGSYTGTITSSATTLNGWPTFVIGVLSGNAVEAAISKGAPGFTESSVFIHNANGSAQQIGYTSTSANAVARTYLNITAANQASVGRRVDDNTALDVTNTTTLANATPYFITATLNSPAGSAEVRVNGTAQSFTYTTAATIPNTVSAAATLGGNPNGNGALQANLLERVAYAGVLSVDERNKLDSYEAFRYGLQAQLPTSNPYYSAAPTITTGPN